VCGIVATAGRPETCADAIVTALRHRGPDSVGSVSMATCALAMARLAIMDPDARADQPMEFAGATLVYNGEIYNFMGLRHHLEQRGHQFVTTGDTEVVLHAAVEWGVDGACERLEGMFAFALWDDRSQTLHLARDPFGIKPLYWLGDGGGLVAASEVAPLAAAFGLRPRPDAIREFLRFGSPVTDVAYERVAELAPGTVLTWHDHKIRVRPFAAPNARAASPDEAARASIARQLRSDRPAVLFLSGGFDSALLAAVAADTQAPVSALTLSTRDNFEDVRLAVDTARHYGLPHEVVTVAEADLAQSATEFLGALDQPTVDGFNTFLVARAAVDRGFPVAISGLGGDETLGGYGYSRRLRQVRRARRVWDYVPARLRPGAVGALARWLRQPAARLESILDARSLAATWTAWRRLFDDEEIRRLTGDVADASPRWLTDVEDSDHAQLRHLDFGVYLRATLLRDTDVFSMANSVEVRVPLLDPAFVLATADAAPTKHDLARLMGDELLLTRARARKRAFALPWGRWLPLLQPAEMLAAGGPFAEMIDVAYACRLLAEDDDRSGPIGGLRRWALLVLAHWLAREPAARRPARHEAPSASSPLVPGSSPTKRRGPRGGGGS
jgi:asparagine synthase (glutamine-hydrolysing)